MAEELKGQLSERLPAAVRLMADAVTGGDTKKLFKMMEQGQLDPNVHLPLFFQQLQAKSAGGWDKYTQTIGYQQNQTSKRFEDFIKLFAGSGGNEGFFRIWKAFADTLPRLENIAMALGRAFNVFGEGVQRTGDILVMFNDAIGWFNKQSPTFQTSLGTLGAAFLLLGTKIGRAFLPLTMAFLILEDIASYNQGRKSITGLAFGEDYGPKAPGTIQAPNPYKGMLGGRHINNLEKSGGFFNNTVANMLKSPMVQYNPIFKANQWAAEALFIPNYETTTLTPYSADEVIKNVQQRSMWDQTMSGINSPSNNTINIYPKQGEEDVYKALDNALGTEINRASAQFPVGEGGG